jgi:hypothetical protein
MSNESLRTLSQWMPSAVAVLRLWSSASYSAALLDATKCICRTYIKLSPSGDVTRIPAPAAWSPALFLWELYESLSTWPWSRLNLGPWSLSLASRRCHTWTTQLPIWQFSWLPPCCSVFHIGSMRCKPQSGVPENSGIACEMWLAVRKRASWYERIESWSHSALHWQSKLGTGSCD